MASLAGEFSDESGPPAPAGKAALIITRGLPASGKTTWARAWVAENRANRVRVNRDDLRQMLDEGVFVPDVTETRILITRDAMIRAALASGLSVVADDTNIPAATVESLAALAGECGADFEVMSFTDVTESVCAARDAAREPAARVGADVIRYWAMQLDEAS